MKSHPTPRQPSRWVALLLYLGPLVAIFDRFSLGPLIFPISRDFKVPIAQVAIVATLYYLFYGATQLVFGIASDRYGRVPVMRFALAGAVAGSVVSALAPNLAVLVVGRVLTGGFIGGVIPAALVYIGDSFPFRERQRAVADMSAAQAIGTTLGVLGAGLLAYYVSWRISFALTAFLSALLAVALVALPEPDRHPGGGALAQLRLVFAEPWALFVIVLSAFEGAAFQGIQIYLAPSLQSRGVSAAVAGTVVASYGVATLAGSRLVKPLTRRVSGAALIFTGGTMLVSAYAIASARQSVASILVASTLSGLAFAFMHSTIQTWITEVAPKARGTATALFATTLFAGAAIGTGLVAGLAQQRLFGVLFLIAAALSAAVAFVAGLGRRAYRAVPGLE